MDIDLDILLEKKTKIKLFGEEKELANLTMAENFKAINLRQEVDKAKSAKDEKRYHKLVKELLKMLITPLSDEEIGRLKQRQFETLIDQMDFLDLQDQGVVKTLEEYHKMKADTAKRAMETNASQVFQQLQ